MNSPVPMVYSAIAGVMADLAKAGIAKDAVNEHDRYRYRSIDAVLNALSPILARHGLVILPTVVNKEVVERTSKAGGLLLHVTLTVRYAFVAVADGSRHEIEVVGEASDRADKAVNKAMAAAYKYAVVQVFCIAYHAAEDADAVTEEARRPRIYDGKHPRAETPKSKLVAPQHISVDEVDGCIARWADEIDAARTLTDLEAVAANLRQLPAAVRMDRHLRDRYLTRQAELATTVNDGDDSAGNHSGEGSP